MIFFRIRRHSPAATVRFAPKLQAGAGVATAASMARAGLMTMGSGLARHTFAGLAHFPSEEGSMDSAPVRGSTVMDGRGRTAALSAGAGSLSLPHWRPDSRLAARVAIATAVAGGFGMLCLSYALACVTVSDVLLGACT